MSFSADIHALYMARPHHILPFIGGAFTTADPGGLRVVVVGINAYVSAKDWENLDGEHGASWFSAWFRAEEHKFYKSARRQAAELIGGLQGPGLLLERLKEPAAPECFYATNAIKTYLPKDEGHRASQVSFAMMKAHTATWTAELDLMAQYDVLPHLVIVFGAPFWPHACQSLKRTATSREHLRLLEYRHTDGPCRHHVNRLRIGGMTTEHDALLVRMRHPSARTKKGSASWLHEQVDFREMSRTQFEW